MTDPAAPVPAPKPTTIETGAGELPLPDTIQTRGHTVRYGSQPLPPGASGRRARLHKPGRGGVRN